MGVDYDWCIVTAYWCLSNAVIGVPQIINLSLLFHIKTRIFKLNFELIVNGESASFKGKRAVSMEKGRWQRCFSPGTATHHVHVLTTGISPSLRPPGRPAAPICDLGIAALTVARETCLAACLPCRDQGRPWETFKFNKGSLSCVPFYRGMFFCIAFSFVCRLF